jgi:hypothetical protein
MTESNSHLAAPGGLAVQGQEPMHTEGPYWIAQPGEDDNDSPYIEIHDGYGRTATVYGEVSDPETQATALVLAAAPDLLESVKELKQLLDMVLCVNGGLPPEANGPAAKALAAIARATGN